MTGMTARMTELPALLAKVVEHVRTANEKAEIAQGRILEMARLLDALAEENAQLRADLDAQEAAAAQAATEIRRVSEALEAERQMRALMETRARRAEQRCPDHGGHAGSTSPLSGPDSLRPPSSALH